MIDSPAEPEGWSADDVSCDRWLGGRLTLVQPRRGHRVGSDAALLAAAAGPVEGRVADVGAGVGAVGLAVLARNSAAAADLVEIDRRLAALAAHNVAHNGLSARARVAQANIFDARARRAAGLADEAASLVVTNPPFFEPHAVRRSPLESRARAHVLGGEPGANLSDWIRGCLALLRPGGRLVMIHRPDALAAILAAAEGRVGALALLPVHPRAGSAAHRLIVSAVKGSKAPLRIAPPLVLHGAEGRLTPDADAIHRGERPLDWGE